MAPPIKKPPSTPPSKTGLLAFDHGAKRKLTVPEAHALAEFWRGEILDRARAIAVALIRRDGFAHTRSVRKELARLNLLPYPDDEERWLNGLFHGCSALFIEAGTHITELRDPRTGHVAREGNHIKKWKLRADVEVVFAIDPLLPHPDDADLVLRAHDKYGVPTIAEMRELVEACDAFQRGWEAAGLVGWLPGARVSLNYLRRTY